MSAKFAGGRIAPVQFQLVSAQHLLSASELERALGEFTCVGLRAKFGWVDAERAPPLAVVRARRWHATLDFESAAGPRSWANPIASMGLECAPVQLQVSAGCARDERPLSAGLVSRGPLRETSAATCLSERPLEAGDLSGGDGV